MSVNVLVTGAAGFIGSHVVDRLLARGDHVIGIDNFDPFYSIELKHRNMIGARSNDGFRFHEVDILNGDQLAGILERRRIDVIVHLAAKAGVRPSLKDPNGYVRTNVDGTQSLLTVAKDLGIQRFVFGSSSSVYGNSNSVPFDERDGAIEPISVYAATKRAAELLCFTHQLLYGGSLLCLRFFTVYGPRQRPDLAIRKFTANIAAGQPIRLFGDGSTERDYTWIDDICAGVLAAVDRSAKYPHEFEVINLGGSRTTSLRRLVELISSALSRDPIIEWAPPQPGDVERTFARVEKAKRLLGYEPEIPIEEGITRFVRWYLATERPVHAG